MEIQGVSSSSTSSYSGNDSTVTAAMQSSLLNIESYAKKQETNSQESLNYLSKIHKLLDQSKKTTNNKNKSKDENTVELQANTLALKNLYQLISQKQFTLELKGKHVTYFQQMLNAMTTEGTILGMEKFTRVFTYAVRSMANLDVYADRIDKVSATLVGATGSFKQIGKGLILLSGGLALLGVTIMTFMQAITPEALITFGAIIFTLRMAGEISEGATWDFAKLSVSIALLGISIWAFTELVDFDMVTNFAGSMIAITGAMWLMSKIAAPIGAQSANLLKASGAIAIMAGSLWLFGKVVATFKHIDVENTLNIGLALGGFALVYEAIGKMGLSVIAQGALGATLIGASLWVLAKGLTDINKVEMSFGRGMEIIGMMIGAAGVIALIGNPFTAPFIATGSGLTLAIGASLWVLAKGLNLISTVKVTSNQAQSFKDSLIHTVHAISTLGNPLYAIPIGISTPIALALAASTLGVVGAMYAVSKMPALTPQHFMNFRDGLGYLLDAFSSFMTINSAVAIASVPVAIALSTSTWLTLKAMTGVSNAKILTTQQADNFKYGVQSILEAFAPINLKSGIKAVGSVPIMAALLASTTLSTLTFRVLEKSPMLSEAKADAYKNSMKYLLDAYSDIGLISATKATLISSQVSLLAATTMTSALFLRGFQAINIDNSKLSNNLQSFGIFLDGVGDAFSSNESKFDTVARGVKAFAGVTALTRGLAKSIQSFANLTFEEHEIVNGQIVVKGSTKLTPKDLNNVGLSIGSLLNALTGPLANIGSSKDSYTIAGFTVTNPFSNNVQAGIKAMSRIGSMLKPLTDSVLMFTTNGVDRKSIQLFNWSIAAILNTISTRFSSSADELRKTDLENLRESISMVHNLNKAVSIPNFGVGVKSFNFYAKDLAQVKSVINDINIQKLNGLTMMLGHLAELNRTQGLKALIDSFKQFIEVFMEYTSERKKEIAIQEQRQQEIEDFRNVQTNQNVQTNPFVQNQAITNSLNNIQNQVQKANASSIGADPAVLTELNKIYRKLEALYSDMFVFNKTVSVFVESKQK